MLEMVFFCGLYRVIFDVKVVVLLGFNGLNGFVFMGSLVFKLIIMLMVDVVVGGKGTSSILMFFREFLIVLFVLMV